MYLLLKCAQNAIDYFISHADEPDTTYNCYYYYYLIETAYLQVESNIFASQARKCTYKCVDFSQHICQVCVILFSHKIVHSELNYSTKFYRQENELILWALWELMSDLHQPRIKLLHSNIAVVLRFFIVHYIVSIVDHWRIVSTSFVCTCMVFDTVYVYMNVNQCTFQVHSIHSSENLQPPKLRNRKWTNTFNGTKYTQIAQPH